MTFYRIISLLILGYLFKCPVLFSAGIERVHVTVRDSRDSFDLTDAQPVHVIVKVTKNGKEVTTPTVHSTSKPKNTNTKSATSIATPAVNSPKKLKNTDPKTTTTPPSTRIVSPEGSPKKDIASPKVQKKIENSGKMVRIMLAKHLSSSYLTATESFVLNTGHITQTIPKGRYLILVYRGSIVLETSSQKYIVGKNGLISSSESNLFGYNGKLYRGNMRLFSDADRNSYLVNELPVETYLRGVVPLEIGEKLPADSAAVQAQAVAARTYTYRKMRERKHLTYDLLPTISDQVYGGASAEFKGSDQAIRSTRGLILTYKGEPIEALYHSTCAGMTASRNEVWGGNSIPYLLARSDLNDKGVPYCSISPRFTWTETWNITDFNKIIRQFSRETVGQRIFSTSVHSICVTEKTESGRIRDCSVSSTTETQNYGGDKIRFVFRRATPGNPILYSSNFLIARSGNEVIATGKGYGHGIGMCQTGAIGRARSGQNFQQILLAYYSNVRIENTSE